MKVLAGFVIAALDLEGAYREGLVPTNVRDIGEALLVGGAAIAGMQTYLNWSLKNTHKKLGQQ